MGNENLVCLDNYGVIREEHNMSFPEKSGNFVGVICHSDPHVAGSLDNFADNHGGFPHPRQLRAHGISKGWADDKRVANPHVEHPIHLVLRHISVLA